MVEFFREGGWGMWPILVFGMVALGAAVRFAKRPGPGQLPFIAAMAVTTMMATLHATWTDLGAVFKYLEEPERAPDAEFHRILVVGLKESTRPGALGGMLLTLTCLLVAIGLLRANRSRGNESAAN